MRLLAALLALATSLFAAAKPPLPLLPIPTARQLEWQKSELIMFVHFGVNTYTGREWGTGTEDPAIFRPEALDCDQWAEAFAAAGMRGMVLTAKHHDGFCLWPSKYTSHSVASSPWRGGTGDVVREAAEACRGKWYVFDGDAYKRFSVIISSISPKSMRSGQT